MPSNEIAEGEKKSVDLPAFKRIPRHVAFIPDGNRRWAECRGLRKEDGYAAGLAPGFQLCELCIELGIEESTIFGFTCDNTKRPSAQTRAFKQACVEFAIGLREMDVSLLVVGNELSPHFPLELKQFTTRQVKNISSLKVNFLVNYDWKWDLTQSISLANENVNSKSDQMTLLSGIGSSEISRIDLVVRWGGRSRLSGMLPIQTVYSDIFVIEELWPDFIPNNLTDALHWYDAQDVTLGG